MQNKIKGLIDKMVFATEGHRAVAFYATIAYVLIAMILEKHTDAGALSALLLLYGVTQGKDITSNLIFKEKDKKD